MKRYFNCKATLMVALMLMMSMFFVSTTAEARDWRCYFKSFDSREGDIVTFTVSLTPLGSTMDMMYPGMVPTCYCDRIDVRVKAKDTDTDEIFFDEIWSFVVGSTIKGAHEFHFQKSHPSLKEHEHVFFYGDIYRAYLR